MRDEFSTSKLKLNLQRLEEILRSEEAKNHWTIKQ